jgi:hypothetical protein
LDSPIPFRQLLAVSLAQGIGGKDAVPVLRKGHPNFSSPLLPNFIADAAQNGFMQAGSREVSQGNYAITATGDVGLGNPFLGGGAPRGIQLAAKFSF